MSLTRVWTPSPNYSSGGKKRLIVLHDTEGFTGPNGAYDCAVYFQSDCGASSQVCIDNTPGKVWECVARGYGAWTQCGYNSVAVAAELCGYASWSRDYWLTNRRTELDNAAQWVAEESAKLGIPIRILSASEAQGSGVGVCQHKNLGSVGCGHHDCGDGFPMDYVIDTAIGGIPPLAQETSSGMTSTSEYDSSGRLHLAAIDQHNKVCYRGPNGNWYPVSPNEDVLSGCTIAISGPTSAYSAGEITITYTRKPDDKVCTWQKGVDNPEQWRHTVRGGSYQ